MFAEILMLLGAVFVLLAAIGLNRFQRVLERMHVMSKATTFGFLLIVAGGVVELDRQSISFLVLAGVLQLATSPVSSNLMARATYGAEGIETSVDIVDELAEDQIRLDDGVPDPRPAASDPTEADPSS